MKILKMIGSIVMALALTVSAAEGAEKLASVAGASQGMPGAAIESSGEVTILRAAPDQYMGLSDYTLGVPGQLDKAGITATVKSVPVERKDYTYTGLEAYEEGVPSQQEMVVNHEGKARYYRGALESVNAADNQVTVRLAVPGTNGISYWDVPFGINKDTTMTICNQSAQSCVSSGSAMTEIKTLAGLEKRPGFDAAAKDVVIVNNADTGEVVHIEVNYNL